MTGQLPSAGNYEPKWAEQLGLINDSDFGHILTHAHTRAQPHYMITKKL